MKKSSILAGVIAYFLLLGVSASLAHTGPAVVINFDTGVCGVAEIVDGNLNFASADSGKLVVSNNNNGTFNLVCKAKGVSNSTGTAVIFNFDTTGGAQCGWLLDGQLFFTQRWQQTLSASGNTTLSCLFDDMG